MSKLFYSRVQIVWHDHYGNSEFLLQRQYKVLMPFFRKKYANKKEVAKLRRGKKSFVKYSQILSLPQFLWVLYEKEIACVQMKKQLNLDGKTAFT